MGSLLGAVAYWFIQIVIFVYAIMLLRRFRDEWDSKPARRDSSKMRRWLLAMVLILPPAFGILPSFLEHKPIGKFEISFTIFIAVFMSVVLMLRFYRQDRKEAPPASAGPAFLYRAKDGLICGPEPREKLLALKRLGAIDENTPVAAKETPDAWHPLSDHPAFTDTATK